MIGPSVQTPKAAAPNHQNRRQRQLWTRISKECPAYSSLSFLFPLLLFFCLSIKCNHSFWLRYCFNCDSYGVNFQRCQKWKSHFSAGTCCIATGSGDFFSSSGVLYYIFTASLLWFIRVSFSEADTLAQAEQEQGSPGRLSRQHDRRGADHPQGNPVALV